jgi:alpha-galactosidase
LSFDPKILSEEQSRSVRQAFNLASRSQASAEPVDWLETTCPAKWKMEDGEHSYDWYPASGMLSPI